VFLGLECGRRFIDDVSTISKHITDHDEAGCDVVRITYDSGLVTGLACRSRIAHSTQRMRLAMLQR